MEGTPSDKIPLGSPQKERGVTNVIFASETPICPTAIVRDLRFYYSPGDICRFVNTFFPEVTRAALFISSLSPSFVMLLRTRNVEEAAVLVQTQRPKPNPLCSFDDLTWDFFHSFQCESRQVDKMIRTFLHDRYDDEHCAVCLNPCTDEHQLFVFPCGHVFHTKCVARMTQWECPVCRYAPISSLDVACCRVCGSFDRPFVCLCCSDSFCNEHMHLHYQETGHAYCTSADRRETWNLMSGSSMRRITYDKTGEFVEMCAKEDQLQSYLEGAIEEQVEIHRSLALQRMKKEQHRLETGIQKLSEAIAEKRRVIGEMRAFCDGHEGRVKRLAVARGILSTLETRRCEAAKGNEQLRKENAELNDQVREEQALIRDIEGTVCLGVAGAMSPNGQVHVKLNRHT